MKIVKQILIPVLIGLFILNGTGCMADEEVRREREGWKWMLWQFLFINNNDYSTYCENLKKEGENILHIDRDIWIELEPGEGKNLIFKPDSMNNRVKVESLNSNTDLVITLCLKSYKEFARSSPENPVKCFYSIPIEEPYHYPYLKFGVESGIFKDECSIIFNKEEFMNVDLIQIHLTDSEFRVTSRIKVLYTELEEVVP